MNICSRTAITPYTHLTVNIIQQSENKNNKEESSRVNWKQWTSIISILFSNSSLSSLYSFVWIFSLSQVSISTVSLYKYSKYRSSDFVLSVSSSCSHLPRLTIHINLILVHDKQWTRWVTSMHFVFPLSLSFPRQFNSHIYSYINLFHQPSILLCTKNSIPSLFYEYRCITLFAYKLKSQ